MPILTNTAEATVSGSSVYFTRSGQGSARGEGVISYVNLQLGGAETVVIDMAFKEAAISSTYYKYALIGTDTALLTTVTLGLNATGLYRLPLPMAYCEDGVQLNISISTASTITIDFNKDSSYL